MNERKTMKLWQMLVVVILSAAVLITVFLPAFHINGNAIGKMYKKILSGNAITEMLGGMADEQMESIKEEFDKQIQEEEEKSGIKISSIAPGRIMTHSFEKFFGIESMDEGDEDITAPMKSAYNLLKMVLWIVYMLAFVVILVVILGFCLKWTKYIPLTVSTVYGVAVAIIFGIYQFMAPKMLVKKVDLESIFGNMGMGGIGDYTDSILPDIVSCFWGVAFLIAFIIGLLLLLMSVVCMFVGGSAGAERVNPEPTPDSWNQEKSYQEQLEKEERERQERERQERERQAEIERKRREEEQKQKEQAVPIMGQVMCTKGVASGQGFSLPEDRKVVVGKSGQNANLIINDPHVSNVHCSIRYKAATRSYIVKDHSSNGTFVNGVRLQKEVAMEFPAGTVLQLADGKNEIALG